MVATCKRAAHPKPSDGQPQALLGPGSEASRKLKARIENVLENQRSACEYSAHAIVERHGNPKRDSYYPIARSPSGFPGSFRRTLPGVKSTKVREAIEARQPYQQGYEWLGHLATLINENKHRRLTPQTRTEHRRIRAESGGSAIEWSPENVQFGSGV